MNHPVVLLNSFHANADSECCQEGGGGGTSKYHLHASGLMGSPTVPSTRRELRS